MRSVRCVDPAGALHESVVVLVPEVSAGTAHAEGLTPLVIKARQLGGTRRVSLSSRGAHTLVVGWRTACPAIAIDHWRMRGLTA